MIWPTIDKVEKEAEKELIIVPMLPTQTSFTRTLKLATARPFIIESRHLHHQQTTPALFEGEVDSHMLLQEQTSTNGFSEAAHKIISASLGTTD